MLQTSYTALPPPALALVLALVLAPVQAVLSQEPEIIDDSVCGDLLGYYETISLMDRKERQRERAAATRLPIDNACNQLQLALLQSQPGSSASDQKRALKRLENLLYGNSSIDIKTRQLALLLRDQLKQQQSQQRQIQKLRQMHRQEQATSLQLSKQLTSLQAQLEQLKNIEKNINEKEQTIISPSTDTSLHEPIPNSTGR